MMTCPHCQGRGRVPYEEIPSHLHRTGDPVTSVDGASHLESKDIGSFGSQSFKGRLLVVYGTEQELTRRKQLKWWPTGPPPVSFEAARKRVSELLEVGYVENVLDEKGEPWTRLNQITDKECEVFRISPLGKVALTHMNQTGRTR
jgi:hypothetical protein